MSDMPNDMSHKMTVDAVVAAMQAQKDGLDKMIGMVKSMSDDVHGRWKTFLADHEAALHKWMRDEFGEGE